MAAADVRDIDELDGYVKRFESAYAHEGGAEIAQHLPPVGHPLRERVLCELIRVDLEFGWERGAPKDIPDYLAAFPDLEQNRAGLGLIAFERDRLRRQAVEGGRRGTARRRDREGRSERAVGPLGSSGTVLRARKVGLPETPWNDGRVAGDRAGSGRPGPNGARVAASHPPAVYAGHAGDRSRQPGSYHALFPDPVGPSGLLHSLRLPDPGAADRLTRGLVTLPDVGDEFLGFRLVGELGRGAFGRVYLARQGELADRSVAVKVSPLVFDESQTLAQLQHTNIVPIYSIHRNERYQAVCMPFLGTATLRDLCEDLGSQGALPVSGRDLLSTLNGRQSRARRAGLLAPPGVAPAVGPGPATREEEGSEATTEPSPPTGVLKQIEGLSYVHAVLWMAARLAEGLDHAHERGILHGDLKPANILMTFDGQPMLLDFNLSRDLKGAHGGPTSVGGTLAYMAPEHLDALRGNRRTIDARCDLYSFGVVLYELLAGRRPFDVPDVPSCDLVDCLIEDRVGSPPGLRDWNPAVTPAVESIVHHCLDPVPSRRYQSARELQEDLERHLSHRPLRYAPEPSLTERAAKWRSRHPTACSATTVGVAALLLIAAVGASGWLAAEGRRSASARLHYREFLEAFERCQFYLNTRGGPPGHLDQGARLARQALDGYGVGGPAEWTAGPSVRYLAAGEQQRLREAMAELVLLAARADVARARSPAERERALRQGVAWLDAAERFVDRPLPALYEDRAAYHAALGRTDLAEPDRARSARARPSSARDFYLSGTALLARGRVDRAEPLLSRSVALDPRQHWAWFALGIVHSDQGRYPDAAFDFGVCTTLAPEFAWPHLNRGLALARAGRLPEARASYDRALELDPGLADARVNRALVALELGDPGAALSDLDRAVALGQGTSEVLVARAESLSRLSRRSESERAFSEVLRRDPSNVLSLVARGFARLPHDRDGAGDDFLRALELDPRNARARLGRAHLLRRVDPAAALAELGRALESDPDLGDALELRALLRARRADRAAEDDVDRLLRVPTPRRLYNAGCALALLAGPDPEGRLAARATGLLARAVEAGFPREALAHDADLEALRRLPTFARLLDRRPGRD